MRKYFYLALLLLYCNIGCTDNNIGENVTIETGLPSQLKSRGNFERLFEFPVKAGTAQWMSFETHQQKLDACQIPDTLLPLIPTKELVEICFEYPLLIDAYAYNDLVEGMKQVVLGFNGFQELLKREDNSVCLLNYLIDNDLSGMNLLSMDPVNLGKKTLYYDLAEILLSFDQMINNADDTQKKDIAEFSYHSIENKERIPSVYGLSSITASAYLTGKIVVKRTPAIRTNNVLYQFLTNKRLLNQTELLELKNIYRNSINNW